MSGKVVSVFKHFPAGLRIKPFVLVKKRSRPQQGKEAEKSNAKQNCYPIVKIGKSAVKPFHDRIL